VSTPIRASDQDLRALAAIVSQDRADLPDGEGLPPSLLADLMCKIQCDEISLERWDSGRQAWSLLQLVRASGGDETPAFEDLDPAHLEAMWASHWDCQACSYPERTGDLRSVVKPSDFYSARQWHSIGVYSDIFRPQGYEHNLQLCLPDASGLSAGPERTVRLYLFRGPGPEFSERDRAVLTLLRPHLHQAYLDAERRRHPAPRLTPKAERPAAPGGRRAHQHPDRPAAEHLRGNSAHPPGKHLRTAAGLQPRRRRHPRLCRPGRVGLLASRGACVTLTDDPPAAKLPRHDVIADPIPAQVAWHSTHRL
jgi:hypothetical protein